MTFVFHRLATITSIPHKETVEFLQFKSFEAILFKTFAGQYLPALRNKASHIQIQDTVASKFLTLLFVLKHKKQTNATTEYFNNAKQINNKL